MLRNKAYRGCSFRIVVGITMLILLTTMLLGLSVASTPAAAATDDYYIYSTFDPPNIGDVTGVGGYVEYQGIPDVWGDEIQYLYFLSGNIGYKVRVWVTDGDEDGKIDPRQHPNHYLVEFQGPIEPRHFEIVSSKDLTGYTSGSIGHSEEFYVDSSGIYLGAYPNGINKWDHNWNYIGKIANSPPERTESLAYNAGENVWYAGGRYRTIYELRDSNNDGSFFDEAWKAIFTHPDYAGDHHDGMEYVGGYLWISDMISDVIAKWWYNPTTNNWEELNKFTYTEAGDVEGMGFGPNDHFWVGSGWGSNSYIYELGNEITKGYPIANAGPDFEASPPAIQLLLDASSSHHTDPTKQIALYEWDFESDGIWDYSSSDNWVRHAYPAYYKPDGSIDWDKTKKDYTITLKVTDNGNPPLKAIDTSIVHITAPPWKPIADPNGPYEGSIGVPIQLDGSKSYDPEEKMFPPDHPWYETIAKYEWDLDFDGEFDDSTDAKPTWIWNTEGAYIVGLKVTDSQPSGPSGTIGPLDVNTKYATVIIKKAEKPDLKIYKTDLAQVIYNPDINSDSRVDLVMGKATVAIANIGIKNSESLSGDVPVNIRLFLDGNAIDTTTKTVDELKKNSKVKFYFMPDASGDHDIIVKVDPENKIEESDETNNENFNKVTVKDTNGLYLAHVPIYGPKSGTGYGTLDMDKYEEVVKKGSELIGATYPIADNEFISKEVPKGFYGNTKKGDIGFAYDVTKVWLLGKLYSDGKANRMVGVVPASYFLYHFNEDSAGMMIPFTQVGIVNEDDWSASPHEIGHTYNLYIIGDEEYVLNPPGNQASGFWVNKQKEISDAICFMGNADPNTPQWIDDVDFYQLFGEFLINKADPEVLLINGIIYKNGTVELGDWYRLENGIIDNAVPGDYSIKILDTKGKVISITDFAVLFSVRVDPLGFRNTDASVFTLAVPYPKSASKIILNYKEQKLLETNPNTKLLHDAINLIPDNGFTSNSEQRRNALHSKVNEVEIKINENNFADARNKLQYDIKDKLEKWLVDNYQTETPLQYSKGEIISLVDEVIYRLKS